MLVAADYPFLNILWTMIIFFCWVAWIWMLIMIFSDVFRRDISGWAKAGWSVLLIVLPFLGALWTIQGLAPSGYTLEEGGVRIERRWLGRLIPYDRILGCDRRRRPIGGLLAAGINNLFGSHGPRWNPRLGWHYLAITNTVDLVFLETRGGFVVLSPSDPDAFVSALRARRPALGSTL